MKTENKNKLLLSYRPFGRFRLKKKFRTIVFIWLTLFLVGCAGVVSEDNAYESYDRCMQDSGNYKSRLIDCNIVLYSGIFTGNDLANIHFMKGIHFQRGREHGKAIGAISDALNINPDDAEAYYFRGVSLEALGDLENALRDYDTVLQFGQNTEFTRAADNAIRDIENQLRYEQNQANQPVALMYKGMWCPNIQRDSVLYPANEIHIDTVVIDQNGNHFKKAIPARGRVYKNIKKGSTRRTNLLLWQGPPDPLVFQVMVWEYDDGGPLVDSLTEIAVDFALTRGTRTMSKYAVRQGASRVAAGAGRRAVNQTIKEVDLSGQLASHISSLPKALVGANNDLVGAIGIANVTPDAYGRVYQENGFTYNFKTIHRKGGADCRLYFEFR